MPTNTIAGFGLSQGHIYNSTEYSTSAAQRYIATCGNILGAGQFLRSDIATAQDVRTFTSLTYTTPWANTDPAVLATWRAGLIFYPSIHLTVIPASNGIGGDPAVKMGAYNLAYNAIKRYAPGGAFAIANPGFPGVSRFELWNEANTTTGNGGRVDDALGSISGTPGAPLKMDPLDYALTIIAMAAGAEAGWASLGLSGHPILDSFTLGSFDLPYMKAVVDASVTAGITNPLSVIDAVTYHCYGNGDPTVAGDTVIASNTMIANQSNQTGRFNTKTAALLRTYINSATPGGYSRRGFSSPGMGRTEGGYPGDDQYNQYLGNDLTVNIFWASQSNAGSGQHSQQDWNMSSLDVTQAGNIAATPWRNELFFHFRMPHIKALDIPSTTGHAHRDQALGLFYDTTDDTIVAALPTTYWKPWAIDFNARLNSYGLAPPPPQQLRLYTQSSSRYLDLTLR